MRDSGQPGEQLVACAQGKLEKEMPEIPIGKAHEFRAYPAASCEPSTADKSALIAAVTVAGLASEPK